MRRRQKGIVLLLIAATISGLAFAGKLIADKYAGHRMSVATALPPAKDEYARLMRPFMEADGKMNLSGTVKLFDGERPAVVKEKSDFISIKKGQSFYSRFSFQEVICNGEYLTQIDTLHKLLFITPIDSMNRGAVTEPTAMFDKAFSDTASFKVYGAIEGNDKERRIRIKSDLNPGIQSYTIRYSPVDYSIKHMQIRFWKDARLAADSAANQDKVWISEIDYRNADVDRINIDSLMNRVFVIRKGKVEVSDTFKEYRLIKK